MIAQSLAVLSVLSIALRAVLLSSTTAAELKALATRQTPLSLPAKSIEQRRGKAFATAAGQAAHGILPLSG
ncbi:hypothetical protein [Paractinoplanes atraurantiacus]|uniref:Uncharacterized protein n=1 Tax=Paractinoplanes atraurantiacus TaxID=1036182 RepID=A0A285EYL8_9ACTN|nr:hypothetical protein [Actinoplanes atraurantiacus]SNY04178.1 hypothetical protein SAMN05421748_101164 [Actinoplanes atraurantiacus]